MAEPGNWGPDGNRPATAARGAIGWGIDALEAAIRQVESASLIGLRGQSTEATHAQMQAARDQLRAAFDASANP